jgi:polysaccharide export outer membrane protein
MWNNFKILLALLAIAGSLNLSYADELSDLQNLQHPRGNQPVTPQGQQASIVSGQSYSTTSSSSSAQNLGALRLPANKDVHFEYRIGAHDVLEIEVFQVEDLKHTSRVNTRGYISVPLLGPMKVEGLTVEEAETLLASTYAKDMLQNPHVSIFVKEYESQKYTVEGEVKEPGVFPLKGPTTLLQAIAVSKGPERLADLEGVVVFRADAQHRIIGYIIDLEKVRTGEIEDPLIAKNDIIVVPREGSRELLERITTSLRGFIGFGQVF